MTRIAGRAVRTVPGMSTADPGSGDRPLRSAVRGVRRVVLTHRRLVAALCAAIAVATALSALRPPEPPSRSVVVAARDLASGTTVSDDDVELRDVPLDVAADNAYHSTDAVVGEVVGAPLRTGETITDLRLLASDLLSGYPEGTTLATVRIADPQALWGVEVGTYVDIVGVDIEGAAEGEVIAQDAQVAAIPAGDTSETELDAGAVLVVNVPSQTAVSLTDASSRMQLGVVVSDPPRAD